MRMDERGLSLIELLVGMALLGVILAGAFNVLVSSGRVAHHAQSRTAAVQQARAAFLTLVDDLRNATAIGAPAPGTEAASISYTDRHGQAVTVRLSPARPYALLRNAQPLTAGMVEGVVFARDNRGLTTITLRLEDPSTPTGIYTLSTTVFTQAVAP